MRPHLLDPAGPLSLRAPTQPWEAEGISTLGSVVRYVGALAISFVVWLSVADYQDSAAGWIPLLDLALGVIAFAVVHRRRTNPMLTALGLCALSVFSAGAAGPATLASVSVATRRHLPQVVLIGLANLATAQAFSSWMHVQEISFLIDLGFNFAFISAMMAWGMYIGSRRELLHNLTLRAEQAEAEQELRAATAKGDERARIAREMHDVLAHRISQVSMLSGALSFRTDLTADQMREHANIIQTQANAALEDLRAVLGVLRDGTSGALLDRPQPVWSDLPQLVEEFRLAGAQIAVDDRVEEAATLSATTGRTAYRVVQESVTNAGKHAPGARVSIEARGNPSDGLHLWVRNPLGFSPKGTPGSGLGLVGLAERAALVGGTVDHGSHGGEFVLEVWLPWTP